MAYRRNLLDSIKNHLVVHVSLLKRAVGPTVPVSAELPTFNAILQAAHVPSRGLDHKLVHNQRGAQAMVLVQWEGLLPSLVTWEDSDQRQRDFPATSPWGQGGTLGGGPRQ